MTGTWTWATVTQVSPLRIKADGDTAALDATTGDLVGSLAVLDRVRVHLHADGIIVTGLQGGAPYVPLENGPLAIMRARMSFRDTEPVVIAHCGHSIVAGTDAGGAPYRYVNLLARAMQVAYPLGNGQESPPTRSLADAVGAPSVLGVQSINAGVGGTEADTFLTATTGPQIAALHPAAYIIYVGINDWTSGVTAATYKANLKARLAQLRADTAGTPAYILIQGWPRTNTANTQALWDSYGVALKEIAAANPTDTLVIDVQAQWAALGIYVNGSDNIGIMSDTAHPNAEGHALLADQLRVALSVPPVGVERFAPGPNLLANSNFMVNQRAAASGASVADNTYFLDQWKNVRGVATSDITWSDSGGVRTVILGTATFGLIQQPIDKQNIPAGSYTLSWSGTATAIVHNAGTARPTSAASPITVTLDGTANVNVEFRGYGQTISNVKLEPGTAATAYRSPSYADNLRACRWYFNRFGAVDSSSRFVGGFFSATTNARFILPLPPMRALPTMTSGTVRVWDGGVLAVSALVLQESGYDAAYLSAIVTGATANTPCELIANSGTSFIAFSAEL